jgi:hypothetical protein
MMETGRWPVVRPDSRGDPPNDLPLTEVSVARLVQMASVLMDIYLSEPPLTR